MYEFGIERAFSFSDEGLAELLLSTCEGEEDPLDLIFDEFRQTGIKRFLEQALEVERDMHLGFEHYRRGVRKEDSRNGYYERDIELAVGLVEGLRVPRTRKNTFQSKLIGNYKRRQASVELMIREMFIRGVSTRQVGEILKPLLGIEPSATTVSRIAKELDKEVKRYKNRILGDDYAYLMADAATMKVKEAPQATKKLVLCVYGITGKGVRQLVHFQQEPSESEAAWTRALNHVYNRGLIGEKLKLIVTDGNQGLIKALEMVYPSVLRQRCWAHKLRNVANCCHKRNEKEVVSGARLIYLAKTRRDAVAVFKRWRTRWSKLEPKAVETLEKDIEELLTVFGLPEEHRKMMRTTNVIERLFREVRRRTRPMSCFTNAASCDRIIYAVFSRFNRHWQERPLALFTQKG